ncbi:MAG: hypothetical protein ACFFED_07285 [Candidatus Thorarchaeota archaeon]
MIVDESIYLILKAATGAFSCKTPPIPKDWNPGDRPHIAHLVSLDHSVFRVYLSIPQRISGTMKYELLVSSLEVLPADSIIEIRHNNTEFSYYRKDNGIWTKIAESISAFMFEVFSHGAAPVIIDIQAS